MWLCDEYYHAIRDERISITTGQINDINILTSILWINNPFVNNPQFSLKSFSSWLSTCSLQQPPVSPEQYQFVNFNFLEKGWHPPDIKKSLLLQSYNRNYRTNNNTESLILADGISPRFLITTWPFGSRVLPLMCITFILDAF